MRGCCLDRAATETKNGLPSLVMNKFGTCSRQARSRVVERSSPRAVVGVTVGTPVCERDGVGVAHGVGGHGRQRQRRGSLRSTAPKLRDGQNRVPSQGLLHAPAGARHDSIPNIFGCRRVLSVCTHGLCAVAHSSAAAASRLRGRSTLAGLRCSAPSPRFSASGHLRVANAGGRCSWRVP